MEETTDTMTETTPKRKRISRTARWAMAHPFMIYEVTDPELRSLLCYYRKKDRPLTKEEIEFEKERRNEGTDA